MTEPTALTTIEIDVRIVPKPQRHPLIFDRFAALPRHGALVLINNHNPRHLRQEFDRDHPGTYAWDYLETGPVWRIQITKLTDADLPRIIGNTHTMDKGAAAGSVWKLEMSQRHLDANVIRLEPHGQIAAHIGPDLDILLHILDGTGQLTTEVETVALCADALVWLPRRSQRSITAGTTGLRYLTLHPRRPALTIDTARALDTD